MPFRNAFKYGELSGLRGGLPYPLQTYIYWGEPERAPH